MNFRQVLSTSIAFLLTHAAWAADPTANAQPITLAATAGLDQSDFHLLRGSGGNSFLFFSAVTKATPAKGNTPAQQTVTYYSQRVESLLGGHFFLADKSAPLVKKSSVVLPAGTALGDFRFQSNSINQQVRQGFQQEFFHVPTKGLYYTSGGGAPVLVKAETAANPISGYALYNPEHTANDTDHSLQFRAVLGAYVPKTSTLAYTPGDEPFISQGPSRTTVALKTPSGNPVTQTHSFTTFKDPSGATGNEVAYFVGEDTAGVPGIYKTTVNNGTSTPKYGATLVSADQLLTPNQLTGCSAGLVFVDDDGTGTRQLYAFTTDQSTYNLVSGAGTNPQDLTPNQLDGGGNLDGMGYTSVDGSGKRRFSVYSGISGAAIFTDSSASYVNPVHITASGDYFYYGATFGNFQYAFKDFNGSHDDISFLQDPQGNYLVNPTEFCLVGTGNVYFVADAVSPLGQPVSQGLLYSNDGSDTTAVATRVTNTDGHPIVKAHNLRGIADGTIFRLYFSAPINATDNSDELIKDRNNNPLKDKSGNIITYASKPWVVNDLP